jgi:hypothetical protein
MRWAGHGTRMGKSGMLIGFLLSKAEGNSQLGITRCKWGIILKWILEKCNGVWTSFTWLRPVEGSSEIGNEY